MNNFNEESLKWILTRIKGNLQDINDLKNLDRIESISINDVLQDIVDHNVNLVFPEWSLNSEKPTYSSSEVGAISEEDVHELSVEEIYEICNAIGL